MPHFASNSLQRFSPFRGRGRQRNRKPDIRTERGRAGEGGERRGSREEGKKKEAITGFRGI